MTAAEAQTIESMYARLLEVCNAGRALIVALDRMHGGEALSLNANEARERLRAIVSFPRDPRDERPESLHHPARASRTASDQ